MNRCEERYIYNFFEVFYPHLLDPVPTFVITIATINNLYNGSQGATISFESIKAWLTSRMAEGVDNSLINAVLARLQGENPYIAESDRNVKTRTYQWYSFQQDLGRHAVSWFMKTAAYYEMRASLLNKTAGELLAQVQSQIITERKTDTDTGKEVSATSDMPVTETFADALASPNTLADKISELNIAQRDYSHKWKDQVDTKDDRFTLPERIQTALDVWDDMVKEWTDAFLDEFSIAPSGDWEEAS